MVIGRINRGWSISLRFPRMGGSSADSHGELAHPGRDQVLWGLCVGRGSSRTSRRPSSRIHSTTATDSVSELLRLPQDVQYLAPAASWRSASASLI